MKKRHILNKMIEKMKYCYLVLLLVINVLNISAQELTPIRPANWDKLNVDEKADWLVSQMTLEEKVEQINIQPHKSKSYEGLGSRSQIWNKRLGIGPIHATNGPRGPRPSGFKPLNRDDRKGHKGPAAPTGLALASSWNTEVWSDIGKQWGLLVKDYGLNTLWAPGVNIIKDPRSGRNTDYASEDPYFTGAFGMGITKGLQSVGVAATVKHLAANNWESGRQSHNVEVPMRSLREIYLPCFRIPIEEGGAQGIMTCYNSLNGEWGSANKWLLTDIVRKEWGFKGFFVSDWGANFGSAAQAIKSGQNIELPGQSQLSFEKVKLALDAGEITIADLDARVKELVRYKLDKVTYFGDETPSGYSLENFSKAIRKAGGEALVLLKNKNKILPLKKSQSVALIGPFANNEDFTIGNAGSSTVYSSYTVTLKQALESRGINVNYEQGDIDPKNYTGAELKDSFPCKVEYFNGFDMTAPVAHSEQRENLILKNIQADADFSKTILDGFKGKAVALSGKDILKPLSTPTGKWTVRFNVRLADQLPEHGRNIVRFFANEQTIMLTTGKLEIKTPDLKKDLPISWNDMDKRWLELVFKFDGNKLSFFRNGKMEAEVAGFNSLKAQDIIFGYNNEGLTLDLDEIEVWNNSFNPDQLSSNLAQTIESFDNIEKFKLGSGVPNILETRNMSFRATSLFKPIRPGKVVFEIETIDGLQIYIDGALVYDLNDEQKGEGNKNAFWYYFNDINNHQIVVEYRSKQKYRNSGNLSLRYSHPPATDIFNKVIAAAKSSDVAVVCVGVPSDQQSENKDRPRFEMPSYQNELIQAVRKANPKTVVVLFSEGGVDVSPWINDVPGLLETFHPGSEGGNIIADVLYGDANPSGKLTITWPIKNEDLPVTGPNPHYKNTINEFGYRFFDANKIKPRFAFGYGLSYTTFKYNSIKTEKSTNEKYPFTAKVSVKNTGKIAGKEVVQVYVTDKESKVEQAKKELAGFTKVHLEAGETKTVEIPLHWLGFKYFDIEKNKWALEPGEFIISAGGASDKLPLSISISAK